MVAISKCMMVSINIPQAFFELRYKLLTMWYTTSAPYPLLALEKRDKIIEQLVLVSFTLGGNLALSSALWDAIRIENAFRRGLTSETVADSSLSVGKVTVSFTCWPNIAQTSMSCLSTVLNDSFEWPTKTLSSLDQASSSTTRRGWVPAVITEKSAEKVRPHMTGQPFLTSHSSSGLWKASSLCITWLSPAQNQGM